MKVIVVPTDFSGHSLHAIDRAVAEARAWGSEVHLLHVVEHIPPHPSEPRAPYLYQDVRERLLREAREEMDGLRLRLGDARSQMVVREGAPATEIVAYADEVHADLIVMATHGRRGLARVFLGSVTEAVLRRAGCPVLSVRPTTPAVLRPQPAPPHLPRPGLKVRDIMRRDAVRVHPDTPVRDVVELMILHDVSGIPVVDAQDNLLGYIPESHLLLRTLAAAGKTETRERLSGLDLFLEMQRQAYGKTARDLMRERARVVTIAESADLTEAVERMLDRGVTRMPVLRGERLVGYLTRADILSAVRDLEGERAGAAMVDERLSRMVREALARDTRLAVTDLSIRTDDGVVWLTGAVSTLDELDEAERVVSHLPGVRSVANGLVVSP